MTLIQSFPLCRRSILLLLLVLPAAGCSEEVQEPTAATDRTPQPEAASSTIFVDDLRGLADPEDVGVPSRERTDELPPLPLSEEMVREGWVALFDGHSLFGWDATEGADWRVEDGTLVSEDGPINLLRTYVPFADFELKCDFRCEAGGNSGVFLRTHPESSDPTKDTYELNICDTHEEFPTGSLVGRLRAENVPATDGEWHSFHVTCAGPRIEVRLDGTTIAELTDDGPNARSMGQIGLQKNAGRIEFRGVILRPLSMTELLNDAELSNWTVVDGNKADFVWEDGLLSVTGGPGFLQTNDRFGDFILQAEARTNGDGLNSGIFFRAEPGTAEAPSNGYEMQIQNRYLNNDPTQPEDAGTGAIFRRVEARRVVSFDREWFTATLAAHQDRFMTWVDGYPVVAWQDTRDADANPRRGLRLTAGHISLQAHDPTTDLSFRSVRVGSDDPAQK